MIEYQWRTSAADTFDRRESVGAVGLDLDEEGMATRLSYDLSRTPMCTAVQEKVSDSLEGSSPRFPIRYPILA